MFLAWCSLCWYRGVKSLQWIASFYCCIPRSYMQGMDNSSLRQRRCLRPQKKLCFSAWMTLVGMQKGWCLICLVGIGIWWEANDVGLDVLRKWCHMPSTIHSKKDHACNIDTGWRCRWNPGSFATMRPKISGRQRESSVARRCATEKKTDCLIWEPPTACMSEWEAQKTCLCI